MNRQLFILKVIEKFLYSKALTPIRNIYLVIIQNREKERILSLERARELELRELESRYKIGKYQIKLTEDHSLIENEKHHLLYNQLPQYLVEFLQPKTVVIEVGANVGDNLARMVSANNKVKYISIEAVEEYYKLLVENTRHIKNCDEVVINPVHACIASKLEISGFKISEGTAQAFFDRNSTTKIKSDTLDHIVPSIDFPNIGLLLTDTDGFDYDIIFSASEIIKVSHPIIFFEYTCTNIEMLADYGLLLEFLIKNHYRKFAVFDNFGNLMVSDATKDQIRNLAEYVYLQNINVSTRTIYYLDVLAWTEKDDQLIGKTLMRFVEEARKFKIIRSSY
jgi:FkbM family methyltransferase